MADAPTAEELAKPVSVQNLKDVQEANDANYMPSGYQAARAAMGLGNTLGALPVENGGTGATSLDSVRPKTDWTFDIGRITCTVPNALRTSSGVADLFSNIPEEDLPWFLKKGPSGYVAVSEPGAYAVYVDLDIVPTYVGSTYSAFYYMHCYVGYGEKSTTSYLAKMDTAQWPVSGNTYSLTGGTLPEVNQASGAATFTPTFYKRGSVFGSITVNLEANGAEYYCSGSAVITGTVRIIKI